MESHRREGEICFQESLEFQQRLVVKHNIVQVFRLDFALAQAVIHGMGREIGVVFFSGKALLLRRRHKAVVHHENRSAIVVISRDAENFGHSETLVEN